MADSVYHVKINPMSKGLKYFINVKVVCFCGARSLGSQSVLGLSQRHSTVKAEGGGQPGRSDGGAGMPTKGERVQLHRRRVLDQRLGTDALYVAS